MVSFYRGQRFRTLWGVDDVVLIPEAAKQLGISRQTLWRHVAAGRLPATKVGRDYVIRRADLAAFDAARQKTPGRPRKPKTVEYRAPGDHGVTGRLMAAERPEYDA